MQTAGKPPALPAGRVYGVPDALMAGDCIALCSPGAVVSVPLLVERVILYPKPEPQTADDAQLLTDEIYDILICPENKEIDRLLLIFPHVLFDPASPVESFKRQVTCPHILKGGIENWQYPISPHMEGDDLVIGINSFYAGTRPKADPIHYERGSVHGAHVALPQELRGEETLAALCGLKRSVFECVFDVPVKAGEKRWLRLRLKPDRLNVPCQKESPLCPPPNLSSNAFSQMLDILGADTMLASFRDYLRDMLGARQMPKPFSDVLQDIDIAGIQKLMDYIFANGFQKAGTYTRIEDQRILIVPRDCRIEPIFFEGSVSFQGIAPILTDWGDAIAYRWSGGLNYFARYDPSAVVEKVMEHVKQYAPHEPAAKSKPDIAVATASDYALCCASIDRLVQLGLLKRVNTNDLYYFSGKELPANRQERWKLLLELTDPIASSMVLVKAHYRVFFRTYWEQIPKDERERIEKEEARNVREDRRRRVLWRIAVTGLIIGVLSLILRIAELIMK